MTKRKTTSKRPAKRPTTAKRPSSSAAEGDQLATYEDGSPVLQPSLPNVPMPPAE